MYFLKAARTSVLPQDPKFWPSILTFVCVFVHVGVRGVCVCLCVHVCMCACACVLICVYVLLVSSVKYF